MNERIQELFKRAGGKTSARNLMSNPVQVVETHELWDDRIEKFAELIVRECAEIAAEQGNTAEHSFTATRAKWFRLGAIKSATMIKRTFGVEE